MSPTNPHQPPSSHLSRPVRRELSAGGVAIRNENGQWLVALLKTEHKRGSVWVLPKGHVELQTGENISEAARREVEEEAGLRDLSVKDQLGVTRFAFQAEGTLVKKTVHYFLMVTQQKQLTPQAEEGMIEANWFSFDEAIKNLAYDTDQDIVAKAQIKMTGKTTFRPPIRRAGPPAKRTNHRPAHTRRQPTSSGGGPASTAGRRIPRIHR